MSGMPRENVIWEHKDGTWGAGLFVITGREYDDDFIYDMDRFQRAQTGLKNQDEAREAVVDMNGGNPGIHCFIEHDQTKQREKYDKMAAECSYVAPRRLRR